MGALSLASRLTLPLMVQFVGEATDNKLVIFYWATFRLQQTIETGEAFDLAILATAVANALAKQGKHVAATR